MQYIRQRDNGSWQVRVYNDDTRFSFTSPDLGEVIERRNLELGYDPDFVEPKILLLDIETAPILAYVWGLWEQNIGLNQIKEDWYILCYGYKWLGEQTKVVSLCDFKDYQSGRDCELELVCKLHELLDEADIVIAHNGDAFDIKKVNAKFLEYGLSKPSPYKTVDTLKILRKHFKLTSNKLDYASKILSHQGKLEHEGMSLWIGCMAGDKKCWKKMVDYNHRDIEELEKVYLALRGWDSNHPNLSLYLDDKQICISCGSEDLIKLETSVYTNVNSFDCYQCRKCGQVMRSRKKNKDNKSRLVVAK